MAAMAANARHICNFGLRLNANLVRLLFCVVCNHGWSALMGICLFGYSPMLLIIVSYYQLCVCVFWRIKCFFLFNRNMLDCNQFNVLLSHYLPVPKTPNRNQTWSHSDDPLLKYGCLKSPRMRGRSVVGWFSIWPIKMEQTYFTYKVEQSDSFIYG